MNTAFTDAFLRNQVTPGRYSDRDTRGLSIQIKAQGGKYWTFRFLKDGNRRDVSLGAYPAVTLKEARRRSIGMICMRHLGPYGIHPHYHLVLSRPDWMGLKDLEAKVCAVAKRINWINREINFETYYSTGAISYLTSDLYWEPVYEACEAAK